MIILYPSVGFELRNNHDTASSEIKPCVNNLWAYDFIDIIPWVDDVSIILSIPLISHFLILFLTAVLLIINSYSPTLDLSSLLFTKYWLNTPANESDNLSETLLWISGGKRERYLLMVVMHNNSAN